MDKIAAKSCDCLNNVPDSLQTQQFNMALGVCMLEASMPYKKQIKKDYDINLDQIDKEGQKLGRIIGVKMATACPNSLIKITQKQSESAPGKTQKKIKGTIIKIEKDFFISFSIKDEDGKLLKLYWLTFIKSNNELTENYSMLLQKNVEITYTTQEFFDPKIEQYRQFLIVDSLISVN